jgi:hypothetical protein
LRITHHLLRLGRFHDPARRHLIDAAAVEVDDFEAPAFGIRAAARRDDSN